MRKKLFASIIAVCFIIALLGENMFAYAYPNPSYKNIKSDLVLLSSFTTSYPRSSLGRCENIRLATSKINGTILMPNEEFSFNHIVGLRSKQNGFKVAKVIFNSKYVDGVGGGVCQVSTTLYNAWLLSGMRVNEFHAHTYASSYVKPSFDAMVSFGYADLKLINNTNGYILIEGKTDNKKVTFNIYGSSKVTSNRISRVSVIEKALPYSSKTEIDETMIGETERIVTYGKCGIISSGYLIYYDEKTGKRRKKKLRRDVYLPIDEKKVRSGEKSASYFYINANLLYLMKKKMYTR